MQCAFIGWFKAMLIAKNTVLTPAMFDQCFQRSTQSFRTEGQSPLSTTSDRERGKENERKWKRNPTNSSQRPMSISCSIVTLIYLCEYVCWNQANFQGFFHIFCSLALSSSFCLTRVLPLKFHAKPGGLPVRRWEAREHFFARYLRYPSE